MGSLYDAVKTENSSYVPQYVGSTYNELNQAAATLDKRWRDNKDYSDKVAMAMANDQYLENDKGIKDKMAQSIYGSIDKIASSDQNFENSTAAVSQMARDYFTNQDRIQALENFKLTEEDRKLEAQGHSLNFGDNRNNFATVDPDTGQARRFKVDRQKQLDQSKKMQDLLGRVASDGYLLNPKGEKIKIDDDVQTFIKTGYGDSVTRKKLDGLVENLIPAYMQTDEGRQDVRIMSDLNGIKDPNAQNASIVQRFKALAYPQAGSHVVGSYRDFDSGDGANKTTASFMAGTAPGTPITNSVAKPMLDPTEDGKFEKALGADGTQKPFIYTDLKGNPLTKADGNPVYTHDLTENAGGELLPNPKYHDAKGNPLYQKKELNAAEIDKQFTSQLDYIKNNAPDDRVKNYYRDAKEYKAAYKEAAKNNQQVAPSGVVVQPEQQGTYKAIVEGMRSSVPVTLAGDNGPAKTIDEWADKLGVAAEDITMIPVRTHYKTPSSDLQGGAIEVQIRIKGKSKTETAYMPLNDQFSQATKIIDDTYKGSVYSGQDNYTQAKPYGMDDNFSGNPAITTKDGKQAYLTHYTVTLPKKPGTYTAGKDLPFDTYVYQGLAVPNGDSYDLKFDKKPRSIKNWEAGMQDVVAGQLGQMINSGQTVNVKDAKESLPEF